MRKTTVSHDQDDKGNVHLINEKYGNPYHEGTVKTGKLASIADSLKMLKKKK